jgi:hypothetical protein
METVSAIMQQLPATHGGRRFDKLQALSRVARAGL